MFRGLMVHYLHAKSQKSFEWFEENLVTECEGPLRPEVRDANQRNS